MHRRRIAVRDFARGEVGSAHALGAEEVEESWRTPLDAPEGRAEVGRAVRLEVHVDGDAQWNGRHSREKL